MDNRRVLSSLCYFSVLFAPFLLPIIVYFITPDTEVKHHAKRSLLSHLIPVALGIIGFIIMMIGSFTMFGSSVDGTMYTGPETNFFFNAGTTVLFVILYGILSLVVLIWNIIQGIKVLQKV